MCTHLKHISLKYNSFGEAFFGNMFGIGINYVMLNIMSCRGLQIIYSKML